MSTTMLWFIILLESLIITAHYFWLRNSNRRNAYYDIEIGPIQSHEPKRLVSLISE